MDDGRGTKPGIHIIGLAGSGKTTLARWTGGTLGLSVHDLDTVAYGRDGRERPIDEVERRIAALCAEGGWVTEGAYQETWIEPLLAAAETVVWLDVSMAVCLLRMLKRHARAELSRTNQHAGWVRLFRFMNYTRTSAKYQRQRAERLLTPHAAKVRRCRTTSDVASLKCELLAFHNASYGGTTTSSSPS